ncbi:MAG TPA: SMC family ATPase [Gemmatimonadales bacterium]
MQIHRLRLRNFRQHEDTELVLGAGLTCVIGPNGAGKTTLLEAIAWAMYGMPAARGSRDTIRRRGAPPRAQVEVELEFSLGAHHYRIVRALTQAALYQDGDPAPIANSLGTVTERIARLLGMTRDEFFNTYFTSQKQLAVMAAMGPSDRAQFLSRVLGYERIRTVQERLKDVRSALRARVDTLRGGLADPAELDREETAAGARLLAAEAGERHTTQSFEQASARLAELRPRWERLQQLRDRALALEGDLRVADHEVGSAAERAERLERQAAEAATAQRRLDELWQNLEPLPALQEEAGQLGRQAEGFATRRRIQAQLAEVRRTLDATVARRARLPRSDELDRTRARLTETESALAAAAAEAESQRTTWVRDAQDASTKREALAAQFKDLREQRERVVQAGPDGDCPTCARPLGAEYPKVLELLDRQIEEVVSNGSFYRQRLEQLRPEPPELLAADQRREELEQALQSESAEVGRLATQVQEAATLAADEARLAERVRALEGELAPLPGAHDEQRYEEVQRRIKTLEPLLVEAARFRAMADQGPAVAADLAAARVARDAAAARAAGLRAELAALAYDERAFREARDAEQAADRARQDAELALVHARAERKAAAEAVEVVARRRAERRAREEEARRAAAELKLDQELDRALADFRGELNAALRPDLSQLASSFLADLTRGRYTELELDDDYQTRLLDEGDAKIVISGGEEDVANLALRLAISQMIAERAGQPLSLLLLDEVFGSLDEDRRSAVVDLLRSLADRFPQVILITHIDLAAESFDRIIRVGYDAAKGVAVVQDGGPGGHDVAA